MRTLEITCDLDSIVVDLLNPWLDWYNLKWNDNLTIADLRGYNIEKIVKPECGWKVFDIFQISSWYESLPILPGAFEALEVLHRKGHDLIIASAVAGDTAAAKFKWCKNNLPFIRSGHILIGARKDRIHSDVFIDDAPKNIEDHKKRWPHSKIMTISYPYNEEQKHLLDVRAEGYEDTRTAWETILAAVESLERE